MKSRESKALFFIFVLVYITSCCNLSNTSGRINGNGDTVSVEIEVSNFDGLIFNGIGNVNIHIKDQFKVVVTTDKNIQKKVLIDVLDNFLLIDQEDKNDIFATVLDIDVYLPKLKSVRSRGSGSIFILDNKSNYLELFISGVGNVFAKGFEVESINVSISGVGNAEIWATKSLSGSISGIGSIYYRGNPSVSVKDNGLGNVRPI